MQFFYFVLLFIQFQFLCQISFPFMAVGRVRCDLTCIENCMTLCHSLPALLCLKGWSFGPLHRCCHGEAGMGAAGLCLLHPAYLFAWDCLKIFFKIFI